VASAGIGQLVSLVELYLDENGLREVPDEIGRLTKLRILSLKSNNIGRSAPSSSPPRQSLAAALFTDTAVISIDLAGNALSKSEVMAFTGVEAFLQRRKLSKDKSFTGGALSDRSLFGLD
jgi:Leucine-rich repeat (LRR) protein